MIDALAFDRPVAADARQMGDGRETGLVHGTGTLPRNRPDHIRDVSMDTSSSSWIPIDRFRNGRFAVMAAKSTRRILSLVLTLSVSAAALVPAALAQAAPVPGIGANDIPIPTPKPGERWTTAEFRRNWGNSMIGQQEALRRGFTGRGVLVGVLDSGVAAFLNPDGRFAWVDPEIAGRLSPLTRYFADRGPEFAFRPANNSILSRDGHGVHVMGTIGAAADGTGMMGIAPGVNLLGLKVFNDTFQRADAFLTAVDWGLAAGTRIFNASLGPTIAEDAQTWNLAAEHMWQLAAVRRAMESGAIMVVAAGNDGGFAPASANPIGLGIAPYIRPATWFDTAKTADPVAGVNLYDFRGPLAAILASTSDPALRALVLRATDFSDWQSLPGRLVAVANIDRDGSIWRSSNQCGVAMNWCISAPGRNILSSALPFLDEDENGNAIIFDTNYRTDTGTSMAAPHVAGALAVLMEAYPSYTPGQLVDLMFQTAQDLGAPGVDRVFGHGLLRLDWALQGPNLLDPLSTATYLANLGTDERWRMSVSSLGGFEKAGEGVLTFDANRSYGFARAASVTGGGLIVNGVLSAASFTVGAGTIVSGNGLIAAATTISGTLSPGTSPGLLTFAAPVMLTPSALTRIEVDGPNPVAGPGGFDRIIVTGAANGFAANGTLAPVTRGITPPANNTFTPVLGQSFRIVEAQGGVTGSFTSLTQPSTGLSPGMRFDTVYRANAIDLVVTPSAFSVPGRFVNAAAAATALDAIRPTAGVRPGAATRALFDALYSGANLEIGLAQLGRPDRARSMDAAFAGLAGWGAVMQRAPRGRGAWAEGFAEVGTWRESAGVMRHTIAANGAGVGVSVSLGPGAYAGVSGGLIDASAREGGAEAGAADLFTGAVYGGWAQGRYAARAYLGYTAGGSAVRTGSTALGFGAMTAEANLSGVFGGAGFEAALGQDAPYTAYIELDAASLTFDSVALSPAGFGLAAPEETLSRATSRAGVAYETSDMLGDGVLGIRLDVAWVHDLVRDDAAVLTLGGMPFAVTLPDASRNQIEAGAEVTFRLGASFEASLGLSGRAGSSRTAGGGHGALVWRF
jgi:hypothetical protein